jgi:hypothetical protein
MDDGRRMGLKMPSRAWTPLALTLSVLSLLAGLVGPAPSGPGIALAGGSAAALLALAALQRQERGSTSARLAMLALVVGVAALGLGATLTL